MKRRSITHSPETLVLCERVGLAIKRARIRRRLTQQQVAERAGLSTQTMTRLEKGDPGVAIANALEVLMVLERSMATRLVELLEADEPGRVLADRALPSKVVPEDF